MINVQVMKQIGICVLALLPALALAQDFGPLETFIGGLSSFINGTLIPLLFGIALLVFLWGIFKYFILGGSDESKRESGKHLMLYSVIGFVIMVSIWGIVNLASSVLPGDKTLQELPKTPSAGE
jgi:hypothetical protein